MSKSIELLRISTINRVLVGSLFLGAVIAGALGRWTGAVFLGVLCLGGLAAALAARRSDSRDVTRLNALEWRDERDRTLAKSGFAAVGTVALVMVLAQVIVLFVAGSTGSAFMWVALVQLVILNITWSVANSIAVRRG